MADKSIDSVSKLSESQLIEGGKVIYGQCYIINDALVQDQITVLPGGRMVENTIALIPNIWEDLASASGKWKGNDKKNYFYWPVTMTDISNDDLLQTVDFECPRPTLIQYPNPEESLKEAKSDWEKFWLKKMVDGIENHRKEYTIQRKEITLKGTEWIDQNGKTQKIEDITIKNNSLGDIENLLANLW